MAELKTGTASVKPELTSASRNVEIYKREIRLVWGSVLILMVVAMGVIFMLPFPGLLNIKIWGYPFPYWYQMTINWIGVNAFLFIIVYYLGKNDQDKANAEEEY